MANLNVLKIVAQCFVFVHFVNYSVYGCNLTTGQFNCIQSENFFDCSRKELTNLGHEECGDGIIDLSSNQFAEFPANALQKFVEIDISDNKIKNLSPSYVLEATKLKISRNRMVSITFSIQLINLRNLNVSNNNITNVICPTSCKQMNLENFDLSHNHLQQLNITDLTKIQILDLSNNWFEKVPQLGNQSNLTTLNLSSNKLNEITNLTQLEVLQSLDLSNNSLHDISSLEVGSNVSYINLSNNRIKDLNNSWKKLTRNGEANITIDFRWNKYTVDDIRNIVQNASLCGEYQNCSCVNITYNVSKLQFCIEDDGAVSDDRCCIERTSTTLTNPKGTTHSQNPGTETSGVQPDDSSEDSVSNVRQNYETQNGTETKTLSHGMYFFSSLGAVKLSFLGFLLLTLLVLIVINCLVGDPVVDDFWWEEKQPGDHPVT